MKTGESCGGKLYEKVPCMCLQNYMKWRCGGYAGESPQRYLTNAHKLPELRDNYEFCPVCCGHTEATYEHLFWDCPLVLKYWTLIKLVCLTMGFTSPITEYADFIKFIDRAQRLGFPALYGKADSCGVRRG